MEIPEYKQYNAHCKICDQWMINICTKRLSHGHTQKKIHNLPEFIIFHNIWYCTVCELRLHWDPQAPKKHSITKAHQESIIEFHKTEFPKLSEDYEEKIESIENSKRKLVKTYPTIEKFINYIIESTSDTSHKLYENGIDTPNKYKALNIYRKYVEFCKERNYIDIRSNTKFGTLMSKHFEKTKTKEGSFYNLTNLTKS